MFQFDDFPFVPQAQAVHFRAAGRRIHLETVTGQVLKCTVTCSQGFPFNPDSSCSEGRMQYWATVSFW